MPSRSIVPSRVGGRKSHLPLSCAIAAVLSLPAFITSARAQDTHYWPVQNGSQATLLGGQVVGIDRDLSAGYYNPGSLARGVKSGALSMFAKTNTNITLSLDTPTPLTATSSIGASAPGMFAAHIPLDIVDGDIITFSYFVRQSSELDMSGAILSSLTTPANAIDLSVFQQIYDGWYGLSWAQTVGEFGVGASLFYSSVSYRQRIKNEGLYLPGPTATAGTDNLYYSFAVRRIIAKGGITWTGGPVSLGAALTLPSIKTPWCSGLVSVGHSLVEIDSVAAVEVTLSRQEDLDADYREPTSLALGAQFETGRVALYASAEWFGSVGEYDVLETTPLESQIPPAEIMLPITQARERVFNFGGGVSVNTTSWLSFFGSARTDNSYRNPNDRRFVGLGSYDLVHVTAGLIVANDRLEVALGGLYAEGSSEGPIWYNPLPSSPSVQSKTEFDQKGFVLAISGSF